MKIDQEMQDLLEKSYWPFFPDTVYILLSRLIDYRFSVVKPNCMKCFV